MKMVWLSHKFMEYWDTHKTICLNALLMKIIGNMAQCLQIFTKWRPNAFKCYVSKISCEAQWARDLT